MFVASVDERRRIAHRAVQTRGGDLREACVARIARDALQANLSGEVDAAIGAHLPARDAQPAGAQLVHHLRAEDVRVADADVARARLDGAAEPRHERLLQAPRPERLPIARVEGAEAREELVGGGEAAIETQADLIDVVDLRPGRGQILRLTGSVRQRDVLEERRRNRIDLALRDPE